MQLAFDGIQYCCQALGEGKVQVQRIKKATEDAKAIVADVRGIWATIRGLFGHKPPPAKPAPAAPVAVPTAPTKPKADEYVDHIPDERDIKQQFVEHVAAWFENHRKLTEYVDQALEAAFASDNPDPGEILRLTTMQDELDGGYLQLSETLRVRAPKQLGPIWDKFNTMYAKVTAEQQARKERRRIQAAQERWQQEQAHHLLIDRLVTVAVVLLVAAWMWALLLSFAWQEMTPRGFA